MRQPGCGPLKYLVLRRVLPSAPPMYQTPGTLVPSCCQTRSGCPSRFKSSTATTLQPGCESLRSLALSNVLPSAPPMYQTAGTLVPSCCQIRSGCPSPFKSPTATILQPGSASLNDLALRNVLPSAPPMYQTTGTLVPSCCQIRSGCPSPFKSPTATILQPGSASLNDLALRNVLPSAPPMYQTTGTL